MTRKTPFSRQIGHLFAYVQHGMDKTIVWGLRSMKKASTTSPSRGKNPPKKGVLSRMGRMSRGALSFISNAGEAYYERYDELKRK